MSSCIWCVSPASRRHNAYPKAYTLLIAHGALARLTWKGTLFRMDNDSDPNCLFCRIVAGTLPSTQVHSDEMVAAFRDRHPAAPTHILIVPRRHISGINAPEAEDGALLHALIHAANTLAHDEGIAEGGYRLVWNVGPNAGQSVFHLHLHLLGGRSLGWPPG